MMKAKKCLYCYHDLKKGETDFHVGCSKKLFGTPEPPRLPYSLNEMAELAKKVVAHSIAVPGVQPKLSLGLIRNALDKGAKGRLTVIGALGGNFILKPPNNNFPEMPENEHLTMKLAELLGIETAVSTLIRLHSGELTYLCKRMDRTQEGKKIHMLDMFQILEAFDKYKGSMEKVGKAVLQYSENTLLDAYRLFLLTLFCFVTGNNDMHLKNFSMICRDGQWQLSPAYDLLNVLLPVPEDKEELALTLNGKKSKLNFWDFERFGLNLGLNKKQIESALGRLKTTTSKWKDTIHRSFLSETGQQEYLALIQTRSGQLFKHVQKHKM